MAASGNRDPFPLNPEDCRAAAVRLRESAPARLRDLRQWLVWRFEPGEKKPRKVPYYLSGHRRTGTQGSEEDRAALGTFEQVAAALESGRAHGVGFAFLPGDGLIGIDLDAAIAEDTGEIQARAQSIIESCASYTEYSPSRRGMHIIVAGESETFKSNDIGLEVFCGRQFFTFTGERYPGTPAEVNPIELAVLNRLRATVREAKGKRSSAPSAPAAGDATDKRAEIESALAFVSSDLDYNAWIDIGATLFHELGDAAGFALWDWWSSRGSKYQGSDDLRSHWRSFGNLQPSKGIFKLARDAGWRAPRRAKPSRPQDPLPPAKDDGEASPPADAGNASAERAGELAELDARQAEKSAVRKGLRKNEDGLVKSTTANVDHVLRHDPLWRGVLAYDEFGYQIVKLRPPPFAEGARAGPWEEVDAIRAAVWLEREWGISTKSKLIDEVARSIAWDCRFNSVRKWLEAIDGKWDGTPRLPTLLQDAFGADQNEYTEHVGTGLLVTAVARIFNPGAKVDTMVVLEGPQGIGKSTATIELFTPEWYVDIIEPPSHKDFYITLQGCWCVEIGEMQSFTRTEVNQVKQAISRRDDKFRAPYDKAATSHPRQCIFIGTTNVDAYLMDPTGGRRFYPVRCAHANVQYVRDMREQLFAEAIVRYRDGFRWWEVPGDLAQHEQDQRYVEDSWCEPVSRWLEGHGSDSKYPDHIKRGDWDKETGKRPVCAATTTDVMCFALAIELGKHTRQDQMRVGQVMRRLGWDKAPLQRAGGSRIRPWVRPDMPPDAPPAVVHEERGEPF